MLSPFLPLLYLLGSAALAPVQPGIRCIRTCFEASPQDGFSVPQAGGFRLRIGRPSTRYATDAESGSASRLSGMVCAVARQIQRARRVGCGPGVRSQSSPRLRYDSSVNHAGTREAYRSRCSRLLTLEQSASENDKDVITAKLECRLESILTIGHPLS